MKNIDGYAIEPHMFEKLRQIAARLDDPRALTWDDRRDLANLLNLIASGAIEIESEHDD